jgi:large subunit ribosomal protein L32
MPVPKRRHSRARGRKRRTHYKISAPDLSKCPNCGETKMPHRVCPHCGYYKGKPVIQIKEEKVTE